ncbi:MAG: biotin--[acetyl-CoA-carboxylase] ligase [Syntrophomonas sp.]|nr:biotin--[acetyl-CoA-carboxylase] ligase [Syntrophomonas sp.]
MSNLTKNFPAEAALPHKHLNILGKDIYFYRQVSSTNNMARIIALTDVPEGTIVLSSYQHAGKGRGRMNRQWVCPPAKGLLMTIILRPDINRKSIPQLTLLCAAVVAETIKKSSRCEAGIKWPNDILINGKKVCGILAESFFPKDSLAHVIIGIGINVNLDHTDLPADCLQTASSLKLEAGRPFSRLSLLTDFITIWDDYYKNFLKEGHPFVRRHWLQNNVIIGRTITIKKETENIVGQAEDISENGGLLVRLADGTLEEFLAEDVTIGSNAFSRNLD